MAAATIQDCLQVAGCRAIRGLAESFAVCSHWGMLDCAHLVFKALCVLDEAVEQSRSGRVPASQGLRFALAYLYSIGDRRKEWFDRQPYDEFWRVATKDDTHGAGADGFGRQQHLNAAFNGIARAAGMERDVELMAAMRAARGRCDRQALPEKCT